MANADLYVTKEKTMDAAQREMELHEWCAKLPDFHAVNRRLRVLEHCRSHPLRWAVYDVCRRWLPFRNWRAPL